MADAAYKPRMKCMYEDTIIKAMVEKFGYHSFFMITALLGVPTLLLIALHWFQENRRAGPTPTPEPAPTSVVEES